MSVSFLRNRRVDGEQKKNRERGEGVSSEFRTHIRRMFISNAYHRRTSTHLWVSFYGGNFVGVLSYYYYVIAFKQYIILYGNPIGRKRPVLFISRCFIYDILLLSYGLLLLADRILCYWPRGSRPTLFSVFLNTSMIELHASILIYINTMGRTNKLNCNIYFV